MERNTPAAERTRARLAVCATCPHYVGDRVKRCDVCGCVIGAKVHFRGFDCPIGKWPKPEPIG